MRKAEIYCVTSGAECNNKWSARRERSKRAAAIHFISIWISNLNEWRAASGGTINGMEWMANEWNEINEWVKWLHSSFTHSFHLIFFCFLRSWIDNLWSWVRVNECRQSYNPFHSCISFRSTQLHLLIPLLSGPARLLSILKFNEF